MFFSFHPYVSRVQTLFVSIDASFVFTGEVLGQRPISQYKKAIKLSS
jgi:hypothetical protein